MIDNACKLLRLFRLLTSDGGPSYCRWDDGEVVCQLTEAAHRHDRVFLHEVLKGGEHFVWLINEHDFSVFRGQLANIPSENILNMKMSNRKISHVEKYPIRDIFRPGIFFSGVFLVRYFLRGIFR